MSTNPFVKKTWQNRLSEFPTRRRLTDVSTGDEQVVDVTREEGQIYTEGDGFTQTNMNNLEQRIFDAFAGVAGKSSHSVPRAVPKDITAYYNDGTLWKRLKGSNGYEVLEDIYVGDYFRMSRPITVDTDIENLQNGTGCDYVMIVDFFCKRSHNAFTSSRSLIMMPCILDDGYPIIGHFGACCIDESLEHFRQNGFLNSSLCAKLGTSNEEASTSSEATISQQIRAEFGDHSRPFMTTYGITSYDTSGNPSGRALGIYTRAGLLEDTEVLGYPVETMFRNPFTEKLSYFNYMHREYRQHLDNLFPYVPVQGGEKIIAGAIVFPYIVPSSRSNNYGILKFDASKGQCIVASEQNLYTLVTPMFELWG